MQKTVNIDLVSLIEQKSPVRLKKEANHFQFGPEYWGACPFCGGGDNRFHVWPDCDRPHYWCRINPQHQGSAPWFLVQYCNMTYPQALAELGLEELLKSEQQRKRSLETPPPLQWQEMGRILADRAERYLWKNNPEAQAALAYLHSRGLTDKTIKDAHFGYVPMRKDGAWQVWSLEEWGLSADDPAVSKSGKDAIRVPPGILIPWFYDGELWKLSMRRFQESDPKRQKGQIVGSRDCLYNADSLSDDKPVMLVEGEITARSVIQEAGDIVTCVATGSTAKCRSMQWIAVLSLIACILQGFDEDEAGDEAAQYWLDALGDTCLRWSPVLYNDANDMLQAQNKALQNGEKPLCTVRDWVQYGLQSFSQWKDGQAIIIASESDRIEPEFVPEPVLVHIQEPVQEQPETPLAREEVITSVELEPLDKPEPLDDKQKLESFVTSLGAFLPDMMKNAKVKIVPKGAPHDPLEVKIGNHVVVRYA